MHRGASRMLELSHGLSTSQLDAIAELEARVVRHDGGRLKLEWGTLRSRAADKTNDVLRWDDGRLLGFLGIYRFGSMTPELTGVVDPSAPPGDRVRAARCGAARGSLDGLRANGSGRPARVEAGRRAGRRTRNGVRPLRARVEPRGASDRRRGTVGGHNPAGHPRGHTALSKLFVDGFGSDHGVDPGRPLHTERSTTLRVTLGEDLVGTLSTSLDGGRAGIYGFVIDSEHRGRGLGDEVLRRVCGEMFDRGADQVYLEVEVRNDRALDLYLRLGFEQAATDDYYSVVP